MAGELSIDELIADDHKQMQWLASEHFEHAYNIEMRARNDMWRFAPVGVLSNIARDAINQAQIAAFARAWLPMVDEIDETDTDQYMRQTTVYEYYHEL